QPAAIADNKLISDLTKNSKEQILLTRFESERTLNLGLLGRQANRLYGGPNLTRALPIVGTGLTLKAFANSSPGVALWQPWDYVEDIKNDNHGPCVHLSISFLT